MQLLINLGNEFEMVLVGSFLLLVHEALIFLVIQRGSNLPKTFTDDFIRHPSVLERINGIFWLGVIPFLWIRPVGNWQFWTPSLYEFIWIVVLCITIGLVCKGLSTTSKDIAHSVPGLELNSKPNGMFYNSLIWTGYLAAYEYLMRGLSFFPLIMITGEIAGFLINVLVYSLIHVKKGYMQALGSIPFGVLLCFVALKTNSFWPAFFIHLSLSLAINWNLTERYSIKTPKYQQL